MSDVVGSRYVDVPSSRSHAADGSDADAVGLLVVLPGRGYHPDKPLLKVATEVAVDRGWRVRQQAPARLELRWEGRDGGS